MSVNTISLNDFQRLLKAGRQLNILDVRTPAEFARVHAAGARCVPLDGLDPAAIAAARSSPNEAVYVICHSGARAAKACERFQQAGVGEVYSIEGGTAAWALENGKLEEKWKNATGGTSPFEAGGLLFVYAHAGGLNVYEAASGKHIATLPCGPGHWNSPIVLQGEIILPEGNANDHATSGVLDIWSLPSGH